MNKVIYNDWSKLNTCTSSYQIFCKKDAIGRKFFVCKCDIIIFNVKTIALDIYTIQKIKDKFKITLSIDEVRGRNEKCILAFLELFDRLKNRSNKWYPVQTKNLVSFYAGFFINFMKN